VVQLDALVKAVELRRIKPVVLKQDGDLELRRAQHLCRILGLPLDETELDLGVARRELRHRGRQQGRPRRRERGQPHAAAAHARDRLELGLRGRQPGDDHLGVVDQRLAGVREPHAAAAAVDERGAGALLERGDLLRDGGLGVRERVRRGRERPVLGDRFEDAQLLDVEHNPSLSQVAQL
jgi:hypothetical protein